MEMSLKRRGFTVIEMLVVIAIISILAGMLSPALRKARNSALNTVCVNNLKQIGTACTMYANDYHGYLPQLHHNLKYDSSINKWRLLRVFTAPYAGTEEGSHSRDGIWFCPANEFPFVTDDSYWFYSSYAPTFTWSLNTTPAEGFCYFTTRNDSGFDRSSRIAKVPSKIPLIGNINPPKLYDIGGSKAVLSQSITNTQLTDDSVAKDIFVHNGMAPFLYGGMAVRNAFPVVGSLPWRNINGVGAHALEW